MNAHCYFNLVLSNAAIVYLILKKLLLILKNIFLIAARINCQKTYALRLKNMYITYTLETNII